MLGSAAEHARCRSCEWQSLVPLARARAPPPHLADAGAVCAAQLPVSHAAAGAGAGAGDDDAAAAVDAALDGQAGMLRERCKRRRAGLVRGG